MADLGLFSSEITQEFLVSTATKNGWKRRWETISTEWRHARKEYTLSNSATELICHQQLDVKKFQSFTGNTLEHALHQRHLTILDEAADLHEKSNSYSVKQLTQATVQFIDIAHEYNKKGSIERAEYMTDYSAATLYIAKEIAIGAAQGARQGISTTIDRICHPIDTVTGMAQGAASIGKALFNMAADIGELEMLYETNFELAAIRSKEISEKYKPIREELKKQISQMTLRDWSRAVTSVATEGLLQQQFLKVSGKLLKNLEKSAVHLMESSSLATAEECLVTTDGVVLKVAGRPGKEPFNAKNMGQNGQENAFIKSLGKQELNCKDLVKQTQERASEILKHIEKPLNELAKNGIQIKNVSENVCDISHIFSFEHAKAGIFGINSSAETFLEQCIEVIKTVDSRSLLQNGPNTIRTYINGIALEIRPFMKDGTLLSINAFVGHSKRKVLNLIEI